MAGKKAAVVLTILGMLCLGAALLPVAAGGRPGVPATITYRGTRYVQCRANPDYPFPAEEKLTTLRGKVTEEMGTRMLPWTAAKVGGRILFNPATGKLIENYGDMLGRTVKISGYPGSGRIKMVFFLDKSEQTIEFPKAFYVHRIEGWINVCGYPVNGDTGTVGKVLTYFWIKE